MSLVTSVYIEYVQGRQAACLEFARGKHPAAAKQLHTHHTHSCAWISPLPFDPTCGSCLSQMMRWRNREGPERKSQPHPPPVPQISQTQDELAVVTRRWDPTRGPGMLSMHDCQNTAQMPDTMIKQSSQSLDRHTGVRFHGQNANLGFIIGRVLRKIYPSTQRQDGQWRQGGYHLEEHTCPKPYVNWRV
jgi:hypothetical protein